MSNRDLGILVEPYKNTNSKREMTKFADIFQECPRRIFQECLAYELFDEITKGQYVTVMAMGVAEGQNRIEQAIKKAFEFSPWLNLHLKEANEVHLVLIDSKSYPIKMTELHYISDFLNSYKFNELDWTVLTNESYGKNIKAVLIGCFEKPVI